MNQVEATKWNWKGPNVVLHICKQLVYQLRNSFLINILGYPVDERNTRWKQALFDIWHVARSVTKKMMKAGKEKGCEVILS